MRSNKIQMKKDTFFNKDITVDEEIDILKRGMN